MRFATVIDDGGATVAVLVDERRILPLVGAGPGLDSVRGLAAGGQAGLRRVGEWVRQQPPRLYRSLDDVELGPAVPDPGAIYTIGLNYGAPDDDAAGPARPLVYAKLPTSVIGHRAVVSWDRSLTANVDPEAELGVVIGDTAVAVRPEEALQHVFGYTCINDISSRDPWLDGDQWLLGKSFAGFCPVGPWVVTLDELGSHDLRLGCTVNGTPIQDDSTARMRHSISDVISYISRHTVLRPGDLIATGTPARLDGPLGPERRLQPGDEVTVWIEGIGELTTTIG
ncbi:MAG TPA: fumarylacetoacetate hydrolase family protein [Candidatus Baltobacteraceae bacterium]|nr:fumarylacetoacetate hydrolase family protein [Candidatus Baltobacteraceae bacterium]